MINKKSIKAKLEELESQKDRLNIEMGEMIKPYVPKDVKNVSAGFIYDWYRVSTFWHCEKSPIDCCIYEHYEDKSHDSCLFCGQPEERK